MSRIIFTLIMGLIVPAFSGVAAAQTHPTEPPDTVEVLVVDDLTSQPLAGAAVTGFYAVHHADVTPLELICDAAGRVVIPLSSNTTQLQLVAAADGHVPVQISWGKQVDGAWAAPIPAHVTLQLATGASVGGVVLNDEAEPVPGAVVHVHATPVDGFASEAGVPKAICWGMRVVADEVGRWTCDRVPAQWRQFQVQLAHPDYADGYGLQPLPDSEALLNGTAVATMSRGRPFSGRVLDAAGDPVEGARVSLRRTVAENKGTFVTGSDGRFDAGRVTADGFIVLVDAEGRAPLLRRITATESTNNLTLALPQGREVTFRLRTVSGKPTRGMVRPVSWQDLTVPNYEGKWTDSSGEIRIHLPNAAVTVDVAGAGFARQILVVPADVEAVDVATVPFTPVTVEVTDAASGQPLRPDRAAIFAPSDDYYPWSPAEVTETGAKALLQAAPHGPVSARVEKAGYTVHQTPGVEAAPGVPVTVHARLVAAPPVDGTLLTPEGAPAAGAAVVAVAGNLEMDVSRAPADLFQAHLKTPLTVTGPDGVFALAHDSSASEVFAWSRHGFARFTPGEVDGPVTMKPWRELQVSLTANGRPLPGVSLWREDRVLPGLTLTGDTTQTDGAGCGLLDIAGEEGELFIKFSGSETATRIWRRWSSPDSKILLDLSASMSGRAVAPEGLIEGFIFEYATLTRPAEPTADLAVAPKSVLDDPNSEWPILLSAAVGTDGSFTFPRVEPGRYLLTLSAGVPGTGWACALGMPVARKQVWVEVGDGAMELGDISLDPVDRPEVGDPAPPLVATTLEGEQFDLTDHAGKVIIIDFWATWCAPCLADLPKVRALRDMFAADDRVVLVSVSLDQTIAAARDYVEGNDMAGRNWHHAFSGMPSPVMEAYGIPSIPSVWVIAPDGRVVARDLRAENVADVVHRVLQASSPTSP